MSQDNYKIIFSGETVKDIDVETVKLNLINRFKFDAQTIARLFSGETVTIKKRIDFETAQKYVLAFKVAGAICEITEMPIKPAPLKLELETNFLHDSPPPQQNIQATFSCPKCGHLQDKSSECIKCGIIFEKFYQSQQTSIQPLHSKNSENGLSSRRTRRRRNNNNLLELAYDFFRNIVKDWFKGHALVAVLVVLLLPLFGTGLIINAVFYTQDHHVLYDLEKQRLTCGDYNLNKNPRSMPNQQDSLVAEKYMADYAHYSYEDRDKFFKNKGTEHCIVEYRISVGNIGEEEVDFVNFSFSPSLFPKITLDEKTIHHIKIRTLDISADHAREHDPEIKRPDDHNLRVEKFASGTLINFKFTAWYPINATPYEWEQLLKSVTIEQGTAEPGNPRATAFARFLANIF